MSRAVGGALTVDALATLAGLGRPRQPRRAPDLRQAVERALHDLRHGWTAAAIDVLERALAELPPC